MNLADPAGEAPTREIPPAKALRPLPLEALFWVAAAVPMAVSFLIASGLWPWGSEEVSAAQRDWTVPFYTATTLWLFLAYARLMFTTRPGKAGLAAKFPVVAAVVAGGFWLLAHEPSGWRVMYDEPGHAGTAYEMYHHGSAEVPYTFHRAPDDTVMLLKHPSQRLGFYPYLGNLIHGLAGSSEAGHLILLNSLLGFLFLAAGAAVGNQLAGRGGALWFVAFLTFLPLTAQLANSGSYDLLFGVLLLAALGQLVPYVRKPDPARLSLLFALGAALTLSRYEGAWFLGVIGLVAWVREGRSFRPGWNLPLAALMLIPTAMVIRMFLYVGKLAYKVEASFGLEHIPGNVLASLKHLFVPLAGITNLAPLGWAGLAGWIYLLRGRKALPPGLPDRPAMRVCLAWLAAVILANILVVASSFWSSPDDPMTARLLLPVWVVVAVGAAAGLGLAPGRVQRLAAVFLAVWLLVFQMPSWSRHAPSNTFGVSRAFALYAAFATRMPPHSLFLAERPGSMGLKGFYSAAAKDFDENHLLRAGVVAAGQYDRVFAMVYGQWKPGPDGQPVFNYAIQENISPQHWQIVVHESHLLPTEGEVRFVELAGWLDGQGKRHPMTEMPPASRPPPTFSPEHAWGWRLTFEKP